MCASIVATRIVGRLRNPRHDDGRTASRVEQRDRHRDERARPLQRTRRRRQDAARRRATRSDGRPARDSLRRFGRYLVVVVEDTSARADARHARRTGRQGHEERGRSGRTPRVPRRLRAGPVRWRRVRASAVAEGRLERARAEDRFHVVYEPWAWVLVCDVRADDINNAFYTALAHCALASLILGALISVVIGSDPAQHSAAARC